MCEYEMQLPFVVVYLYLALLKTKHKLRFNKTSTSVKRPESYNVYILFRHCINVEFIPLSEHPDKLNINSKGWTTIVYLSNREEN